MTQLQQLAWRLRHARARYNDGHIDSACFADLCEGIIEDIEKLMTPTLKSLMPRIEALRRQGFHPYIDSDHRNVVWFANAVDGANVEPADMADCPRRIAESLLEPLRYLNDDDKGTLDNMAEAWALSQEVKL